MFFGICFSEFNESEIISSCDGGTLDEVIESFIADDVDFDRAFDNGQITIIEGEIVTLRRVSAYEIDV